MGILSGRFKASTGRAKWLLAAVLAACPAMAPMRAAAADPGCTGPSSDCVAIGHWNFSVELGGGVRTNPLANADDIPIVVVPHVSYYGKRFFFDDLDLGFTLADSAHNTFNLVASPGYDRVYFYRWDLQNFFVSGLACTVCSSVGAPRPALSNLTGKEVEAPSHPRYVTYLAGPEWTFSYGALTGQLDALHEITGHNHGDEIRAALSIPLLRARGELSGTVGVTWKSAAIVNYYYGVPDIYTGGSALDPFVKLAYIQPLSSKWHLHAFAEFERLGAAIADSPIVVEHTVVTVFAGAVYTF
jgi:MipA family protein